MASAIVCGCDLDWENRIPPENYTCATNQTCPPITCTGSAEDGRCLVECGANSTCVVDCGPAETCEVECGTNAQCSVTCGDSGSCSMDCGANATGILDCGPTGFCSLSTVTSGCEKQ